MPNIFRTGRPTNFKLGTQTEHEDWRPASATSALTSKVKDQGRKVTWRVWQVFTYKSRTKRPRKTKIGRKVAHPMGNIAHQFQRQKVTVQGHKAD